MRLMRWSRYDNGLQTYDTSEKQRIPSWTGESLVTLFPSARITMSECRSYSLQGTVA
jgi:hypothetical protein